jgi:hypothetical protein
MTEIFDNIRGIYDFSLPCEPLRPFIEFFSESSREKTASLAAGNPFTVEMFPSWTPTFWINLGAPYRLTTGHSYRKISPDNDILVLRDTPTIRHNHSRPPAPPGPLHPAGPRQHRSLREHRHVSQYQLACRTTLHPLQDHQPLFPPGDRPLAQTILLHPPRPCRTHQLFCRSDQFFSRRAWLLRQKSFLQSGAPIHGSQDY